MVYNHLFAVRQQLLLDGNYINAKEIHTGVYSNLLSYLISEDQFDKLVALQKCFPLPEEVYLADDVNDVCL